MSARTHQFYAQAFVENLSLRILAPAFVDAKAALELVFSAAPFIRWHGALLFAQPGRVSGTGA